MGVTVSTQVLPPLMAGDRLTAEEFLRRWETMPEVKFAELIGGIVYMPSPLSHAHGTMHSQAVCWLGTYAAETPGCNVGSNETCHMLDDVPQPDIFLRLTEDAGGQSRLRGAYLVGGPELVVEVCSSSRAYDLHVKKELYQTAGVQEYVAVLVHEREIRWHRLSGKSYRLLRPTSEGLLRSGVFPGLWLNVPALLAGRMKDVLATLDRGLSTGEHAAFCAKLSRRKG